MFGITEVVAICTFLAACSAAAPVELGSDNIVFPEDEMASEEPQPAGGLESGGDVQGVVEPFMGGATGHCEASFQPCGGWLPGTAWVIEDTCTSLARGNRTLQAEGSALLGLNPDACRNVVQTLTAKWAGELTFADNYLATDSRLRTRKFDIEFGHECLNATFGVEASAAESQSLCESIGDATTTCVPAGNGCSCTAETSMTIEKHGAYGVLDESRVSITQTIYDYCVQGNRLMWSDPGTNTHIVMRRRDASALPPPVPMLEEPQ